jgi:hypothetical protein
MCLIYVRGLDENISIGFIAFLTIILLSPFCKIAAKNALSGPIPPEIGQLNSLVLLALGTRI